jgi:subtilase family serine protease
MPFRPGAYMRIVKSFFPALLIASLFSSLTYAQRPDRISGAIDSSQVMPLKGNVHGLVRPESDLGRADGSRVIEGVSLNFRLSAAQQKDLNQFLADLGDRSSPNYHKYLTIPQYARRFGMSQNDLNKIVAWVQSQGFTNIKVANNRNKISFDGTVAQIESAFALEMHNYLVDGEVHLANAMNPSVPAALSGAVLHIGHLNDFAPKPRLKVKPNLTSYVSGNHFLTPDDFATIYDLNALYSAGATGSNQKIAIVGQSTVSTTDLNNFRIAAGLPASTVTMKLVGGVSTQCSGDEGESDLDVEWSGGVAKNANITFIYAGVDTGRTCSTRINNVWDALEDALTGTTTGAAGSPVAPFVSTSYGFCEQGMQAQDPGFAHVIQGWVQTGQTLGVTLVAASGDSGAADCDPSNSTSATQGFAVDVPAAIPETTGAGGTYFSADKANCITACPPGGDAPYWSPAGASSDLVSSALEYIGETAWNDTAFNLLNGGGLGASGGGASVGASGAILYGFAKPTWQTGTGVPNDSKRDVPDISMHASADHDGYLFCSEDAGAGTCSSGFRTGAGGGFTIVGGTSAAAPTFTAILALVNQYLGNAPPTGLAPVNPMLYSLYPNNATSKAFNDVTTGDNIVPCTAPSTNCPTGTIHFGFSAGVGYDQVTGLGSVDGFNFAQAWAATLTSFTLAPSPASLTAAAGQSSNSTTITITPVNGFSGAVTFTCSAGLPSGATCNFVTVNATSSTLTIQTAANMAGANNVSVTVKGTSGAVSATTTVNLTITATTQTFSINSNLSGGTLSVAQGATTGPVNLTVTDGGSGFIVNSTTTLPVTYSCTGLPSESTCNFAPNATSSATSVTLTIRTTPPTVALRQSGHALRIFYAALLPGLLGIMFIGGSRKRSLRGLRLLGLVVMLGFSTLWLVSCSSGGGSGTKDPGTPKGTTTVTVNATTGGAAPITGSPVLSFQFTVN